MRNNPNIIAFHSNDVDRCSKFIEEPSYLIYSKEDGIWLGDGMYFWDNKSNAAFWAKEKAKKHPSLACATVTANIDLSQMLDLTDHHICNQIQRLWRILCESTHRDCTAPLGKKLNVLFEEIPLFNYSTIKIYGKYNSTPKNDLYQYSIHSKRSEPTSAVKCIYSVRDESAAYNRTLMK